MEFWPYCYKHLPLILSFHCNNWNSCPILPNINLNSAPIFIQFGILTSSFRTLQFWPYLYTHWSSYLIVLNLGIRSYIICTHWFFDLKNKNTGMLALFLWALELWSYDSKEWNSRPFFINTGILTLSFQTLEFSYFPSKQWNSGPIFYTLRFDLILRNTGILALFL